MASGLYLPPPPPHRETVSQGLALPIQGLSLVEKETELMGTEEK